ncbi:MAG: SelT/SelW/SelH family protein [Bacteroidales bacterium]|nr:SelT/SelW/SelH family protein [Bacteroidales bacterium]
MKEVIIKYCKPCGYLKRAEKVAELSNELKIDPKLISGQGGIFEIAVDGKVVAKSTRSGFPSKDEIVAAVASELS